MDKRIFAVFAIAIFMILSAGIISAADNQDDAAAADVKTVSDSKIISVKIVWDDAGKTGARPSSVNVNLVKDGKIVDKVTLSESNSWTATFKAQSEDGNFKVIQSGNHDGYSVSVSGNADNGFVIVNQIKADALTAGEDDVSAEVNASDVSNEADESNDTVENATGDNATEEETADESNAADDSNVTEGNSTADNQTDKNTNGSSKSVTKEQIKKVVKPIKKHNVTKVQLRNTGIPFAALVVAAFVAVFVPFSRNKK